MGLCKDCQNWDWHRAICDEVDFVFPREEVSTAVAAADAFVITIDVDDDQGLDVNLCVGPEFGCVRFKQKQGGLDE